MTFSRLIWLISSQHNYVRREI